jgi:hypothetical protein
MPQRRDKLQQVGLLEVKPLGQMPRIASKI